MKWKNPGHEFDNIGSNFIGKDIIIFGAGHQGQLLYEKLKFLDATVAFVDKDKEKQKNGRCGLPVLSFEEFIKKDKENHIVIIAMGEIFNYREQALMMCLRSGYEFGKDCFYKDSFVYCYLPIYALYAKGVLYFNSLTFLITTCCNLNCKCCLNFTGYNHHKQHCSLNELKERADLIFSHVDYVDFFHVSGGETFIYPELKEILTYIGKNYRDKINDLCIVTNGTILPDLELCRAFEEYNIRVQLDDYRRAIPECSKIDEMTVLFDKSNVVYEILQVPYWINMNPKECDTHRSSDEDLAAHFTACNNPLASVYEGRLYSCNYDNYAKTAGITSADSIEDDSLDLRQKLDKKIVLEYRFKYNLRGYVEHCKQCPGHEWLNVHNVLPAEQIK